MMPSRRPGPKKTQFGWSIASESQASLDEKKFSCAQGLYPGRWKSYHLLELSGILYRAAKSQDHMMPNGQTFWDAMWGYCQGSVRVVLSIGASVYESAKITD